MSREKNSRARAVFLTVLLIAVAAVFLFYESKTVQTVFNEYLTLPTVTDAPDTQQHSEKYYFSQLGETQKYAYSLIYEQIFSFPEEIRVPKMNEEEFNGVHSALVYDNPELFFLDLSCTMVFNRSHCLYRPSYTCTAGEYAGMLQKTQAVRQEIYSHLPAGADEYTVEKIIHDRLIAGCVYESGKYDSSVYGALVLGKAVCSGYARAAQYLLDGQGIRNYLVTGSAGADSSVENHMWNTVFIDNKPYYLDVTWDDGDYDNGSAGYAYFNVTEQALSQTHTPSEPENSGCVYTDANYFVRENRFFTDCSEESLAEFQWQLTRELSEGGTCFGAAFAGGEVLNGALETLIDEQRIYRILENASRDSGVAMDTDFINYSVNEDMGVLRLDLTDNIRE